LIQATYNGKTFKFNMDLRKRRTKDLLNQIIKDAILEGYTELLMRCPVDTGYMKSSIYYKLEDLRATLGLSADYAIYVEFSGGSPRNVGTIPFFEPSVEKLLARLTRDLNR
jgi:hypothetical protein